MKLFLTFVLAVFCIVGCDSQSPVSESAVTTQVDAPFENPPVPPDADALFDQAFELYLDDKFADSIPLFERAASAGSAAAECRLGMMYEHGHGVDVDHQKAYDYFKSSAEHGGVGGLYWYGRCFHKGIAVEVDLQEALKWYQRALNKGNRIAGFGISEIEAELESSRSTPPFSSRN